MPKASRMSSRQASNSQAKRQTIKNERIRTSSNNSNNETDNAAVQSIQTITTADLNEADLLVEFSGGMGAEEQQYVYVDGNQLNNDEEQVDEEQVEEKAPEISEEELRDQLQALLDSQLTENDESEVVDANNGEEALEDDAELDENGIIPSKDFSLQEITAFMNNQIKKQHQATVLEEELISSKQPESDNSTQQRHIILVTESGDKIILLQSPEEEEQSEAIIEYTQQTELDEHEEQIIQQTSKARQQSFMNQLGILRERHQKTLHPDVITPAVPHMQPIKLIPIPKNNGNLVVEPVLDEDDFEPEADGKLKKRRSTNQRPRVTNLKLVSRPEQQAAAPRWQDPLMSYIMHAQDFVKRRESKLSEAQTCFATPSSSFERRCFDLKHDFAKIEKTIERFRNTINRDLDESCSKLRAFFVDYHLGSWSDEMDDIDNALFDGVELPSAPPLNTAQLQQFASSETKMESIEEVPIMTGSATDEPIEPEPEEEQIVEQEVDEPEREIRDPTPPPPQLELPPPPSPPKRAAKRESIQTAPPPPPSPAKRGRGRPGRKPGRPPLVPKTEPVVKREPKGLESPTKQEVEEDESKTNDEMSSSDEAPSKRARRSTSSRKSWESLISKRGRKK